MHVDYVPIFYIHVHMYILIGLLKAKSNLISAIVIQLCMNAHALHTLCIKTLCNSHKVKHAFVSQTLKIHTRRHKFHCKKTRKFYLWNEW